MEVAKKALKDVIEREKLPKELLQSCLRPILLNLTNIKGLTLSLLNGLGRLLELLSNCFNVQLSTRLLNHLDDLADSDDVNKLRFEGLAEKGPAKSKQDDEVQVAAKIIDLFHLLPCNPAQILEQLINKTLRFEEKLTSANSYGGYGTSSSSPYRKPLIKFLDVCPNDTVEFFYCRLLQENKYNQMFRSILRSPDGGKIRQTIMSNPKRLIEFTFHYDVAQQVAQQVANPQTPGAPPQVQATQDKLISNYVLRC